MLTLAAVGDDDSNAPLSTVVSKILEKLIPRASNNNGELLNGSTALALMPVLIAGLPGKSECVGTFPPLSCNAPSSGSMPVASFVCANVPAGKPFVFWTRFPPTDVIVPELK